MKQLIWTLSKLAAAGATICAIGWLVLLGSPEGEIAQPAEAVIFDLFGKSQDTTATFGKIIADSGLQPRAYKFNGNQMFFAAGETELSPTEVLAHYQKEFTRHGINQQNHTNSKPLGSSWMKGILPDHNDHQQILTETGPVANAMLSGDIVPLEVKPNHVTMGGMILRDAELTGEQRLDNVLEQGKYDYAKNFQGFRWIDAIFDPEVNRTQITTVWSDNDFDVAKMNNTAFVQEPADPEIPSCIGCTRDFRVESLSPNERYAANQFQTRTSLDITHKFYETAMKNRGWNITGAQPMLDRLAEFIPEVAELNQEGRLLDLERDGSQISIVMYPLDDGTVRVTTLQANK